MISTADVQARIIAALRADAGVVGVLGGDDTEVREEQWMGTDYEYPCYRVHVTRLAPVPVASNCDEEVFDCDFNVAFRSVGASSKSTADGMAAGVGALVGKKLSAPNFVSRVGVNLEDAAGPIAESENAWMARAFFSCRIQKVT